MDAAMLRLSFFSFGFLLPIMLLGCNNTPVRLNTGDSQPNARGSAPLNSTGVPRQTTIPSRLPDFEDKESLIPPPPSLASLNGTSANQPANELKQTGGVVETSSSDPTKQSGSTDLNAMKSIYQHAAERYAKIDAFECRLTRREVVNNKAQPEEVIAFRFRKQAYSVHLRWIGTEGQGREVVYVAGKYENKMQVLPARSDMPLGLRPMRQAYAPTDSVVRSNCRHDIREAGVSEQIRQLGTVLARIEKNPAHRNQLKYLGQVKRPEYANALEGVEETVMPRTETLLPQGGRRLIFFDPSAGSPSAHLPVLVITYDSTGKEAEYYCFDRFLVPIRLDSADFDPDRLWKR